MTSWQLMWLQHHKATQKTNKQTNKNDNNNAAAHIV